MDYPKDLAWQSLWLSPCLTGKAIINKDLSFRTVNQEFCDILDSTPGELVGKKFTEFTPEPARSIEIANADLTIQRTITGYYLKKTYQLYDGRRRQVSIVVKGVFDDTGEFLFFTCDMISNDSLDKPSTVTPKNGGRNCVSLKAKIAELVDIKTTIIAIITAIALSISYILENILLK